ncbi:hypothetical protein NL676_027879 [Syzygium grande]|nr:hypothetical protein NL676_027879 [Syzygium grande]
MNEALIRPPSRGAAADVKMRPHSAGANGFRPPSALRFIPIGWNGRPRGGPRAGVPNPPCGTRDAEDRSSLPYGMIT